MRRDILFSLMIGYNDPSDLLYFETQLLISTVREDHDNQKFKNFNYFYLNTITFIFPFIFLRPRAMYSVFYSLI